MTAHESFNSLESYVCIKNTHNVPLLVLHLPIELQRDPVLPSYATELYTAEHARLELMHQRVSPHIGLAVILAWVRQN